ncbi:hypothetical protein DSOUD_1889 [Desulfuromonas soudanensis]|uniref:Replication-associated protein ORF2/G2P domain-containing protein n=1 Tax=Desulfuromonas soudanensis TaxID=1603606 RepID=A0A0M5IVY3_9BACT|nr:hypothetical protein [Desulfuromonas soudanensis]ALC16661.1 hypothetical protein DSOUD_1889 [Desulfuromonas soudanensis]
MVTSSPPLSCATDRPGGLHPLGRTEAQRAVAGIGVGGAPLGATSHGQSPLVTTSISQQNRLELFPVSLRVKRPGQGNPDQTPPDRSGSWIGSFSAGSRRRLRFRAVNAFPALVSQFGLTYHDQWPVDGRTSKAHLNAWLTAVRRIIPGVGYLWLLEFQKRNAPHYHVFLTVPPDEETRLKLAEAWCRITSPGDAKALRFHQDQRNWITWDMGTGSYLCKYLDKEAQKAIPDGYHGFGRFWGNSRGLEPEPVEIPLDDLDGAANVDQDTGEIYGGQSTVIRWLGRLAEKQTGGYSRFRKRAPHGSYTILQGAAAYKQIERYFCNTKKGGNHG